MSLFHKRQPVSHHLRPGSVLHASLAAWCGAALAACMPMTEEPGPVDPGPPAVDRVDPFIGSDGFGYTMGSAFVGAASPRGLCKVGPDTAGEFGTVNFQHYAGYWFQDTVVQGFSHLHFHGTGATDYGVISVMPVPSLPTEIIPPNYQSPQDKTLERVRPGRYATTLLNGPVSVDITAKPHSAHHVYTFAGASGHVLLDLNKTLQGGDITLAQVTLDAQEQRIFGMVHHVGGMSRGFGGYDVFFAARTRQPWVAGRVWSMGGPPAEGTVASGVGVGAALEFNTASGEPVELQLAVSLVDAAGARANLDAEMPAWAFQTTATQVRDAWALLLDRVEVQGGSDADRRMFHTALYHAFLMPTRTGDVDGRFRTVEGGVQQETGFHFVTDLSLWDSYRTVHPLLQLIWPEDNRDTVRSLMHTLQTRGSLVRWPLATGESGTMLGSPAEVVIADAHLKGGVDGDLTAAYDAMRAAALDPAAPSGGRGTRPHTEDYIRLGYVPDTAGRSASVTVEYAANDFALGNLAAALGRTDDATTLHDRSRSWRRILDPAVGFLRARKPDGAFSTEAYAPTAFLEDYAEANGWQTLFGGLHDPEGYTELLGSREAAVMKLAEMMEGGRVDRETAADPFLFGSAMRPYFWPSNQPSIHLPSMFALWGRHDLTARWVRWTVRHWFSDAPNGLPGNDDGGTMSSWLSWSMLGLYPVAGSATYVVGTPAFPKVILHRPQGDLTVEAVGVSEEAIYVQSATLNGQPLESAVVQHADVAGAATLRLVMGTQPSSWGAVP